MCVCIVIGYVHRLSVKMCVCVVARDDNRPLFPFQILPSVQGILFFMTVVFFFFILNLSVYPKQLICLGLNAE